MSGSLVSNILHVVAPRLTNASRKLRCLTKCTFGSTRTSSTRNSGSGRLSVSDSDNSSVARERVPTNLRRLLDGSPNASTAFLSTGTCSSPDCLRWIRSMVRRRNLRVWTRHVHLIAVRPGPPNSDTTQTVTCAGSGTWAHHWIIPSVKSIIHTDPSPEFRGQLQDFGRGAISHCHMQFGLHIFYSTGDHCTIVFGIGDVKIFDVLCLTRGRSFGVGLNWARHATTSAVRLALSGGGGKTGRFAPTKSASLRPSCLLPCSEDVLGRLCHPLLGTFDVLLSIGGTVAFAFADRGAASSPPRSSTSSCPKLSNAACSRVTLVEAAARTSVGLRDGTSNFGELAFWTADEPRPGNSRAFGHCSGGGRGPLVDVCHYPLGVCHPRGIGCFEKNTCTLRQNQQASRTEMATRTLPAPERLNFFEDSVIVITMIIQG